MVFQLRLCLAAFIHLVPCSVELPTVLVPAISLSLSWLGDGITAVLSVHSKHVLGAIVAL